MTILAAWWAFWDSNAGVALISRLTLRLAWLDPILTNLFLFWSLPIAGIAAIQLICYTLDRAFLSRQWTTIDLLRLTFWRTASPTIAILFLASGFNAIYDRRFLGIMWLVVAAVADILGTVRLRSAEGMKLQEVKGGELYKRAFALAKVTKTPLKRVYVVPAGRGHLTNAYGASHTIAVTDNYGKFLTSAQLDFVIGHELGHAKGKHGRKKLAITAAVIAAMAVVCFSMSTILLPYRPLLDVLVVFAPALTFYFMSRRFEYAADAAAVELTRNPETAIRALVNLHRYTEAPMDCGKITELFMTHPPLTRRARAIGEKAGVSPDRISEAIGENELTTGVPD
ncbi:MAG TPA: M48 family metalloprotease [Candidatus Sulfotelmatobacter sp.]|nr:M48 family metalloprotease [Candidatus Sulfotelmatobacter sp.]